jgi:type I restriction enzyme M protein
MANPPFNVDEIDADKIKDDPRLPFGLPAVNPKKKVSNGNYVWISYFYSYLNEIGRAGFVMSSQASSSGRLSKEENVVNKKNPKNKELDNLNSSDDANIRKSLVETGHVDAMISIRSNFFYTRSVPCELWFFDKGKPKDRLDKVLMIDARNVYRKVTRKINDFSPEQIKNLSSIVWLYRGEEERFLDLVQSYQKESVNTGSHLTESKKTLEAKFKEIQTLIKKFCEKEKIKLTEIDSSTSLEELGSSFFKDTEKVHEQLKKLGDGISKLQIHVLLKTQEKLNPISQQCEDLTKDLDLVLKTQQKL